MVVQSSVGGMGTEQGRTTVYTLTFVIDLFNAMRDRGQKT